MIINKTITNERKVQIAQAIKNGIDISELIEGYDIRGLDLSNSFIKRINRVNENISNTNFFNSTIGEEKKLNNLSGCNFMGCNFTGVKFLGTVWMRHTNCRNVNFNNAYIPYVSFQYADLRNASFCDAVIQFGSLSSLHCKFSKKNIDLLCKYWEICED